MADVLELGLSAAETRNIDMMDSEEPELEQGEIRGRGGESCESAATVTVTFNENGASKRKGRGFVKEFQNKYRGVDEGEGESLASRLKRTLEKVEKANDDANAARSLEGWILLVTGVHEETIEDDLWDKFMDFGDVKNLHLNQDRRTGFMKGYALVEYATMKEAKAAKEGLSGKEILGNQLQIDFAFSKKPHRKHKL